MASAPGIPQQFYLTQGDGKVYLQWNIVAGATSYQVQRSTDGVTFTVIASPTVNNYLDTSALLGVYYYYQVASTNITGTSAYTAPLTTVPTMGGEMSLIEINTRARQRADRLYSNFVSTDEITSYINQSNYELYDLLIDVYEDYFKAPNAIFNTTGNNQYIYPLPNGVLTFLQADPVSGVLTPFVPAPIYKLLGVDMGLNISNNGWVRVDKYMFVDRDNFFYPNSASTIYGVFNVQYRWLGSNIEFIPVPSANQPIRIQYIPRLPALIQPQDISATSISGWLEYVIVDVAIKILQKEESDTSALMMQKEALKVRIQASANNRDAGTPDRISDSRGNNWWSRNGNFNGSSGGW